MRSAALYLTVLTIAACGEDPAPVLFDADPRDAPPDGFVPLDAPDDTFQPDLVLVPELITGTELIDFRTFNRNDAAVVEGCVAVGTRKLLRFDTVTANIGNLDLWVGVPGPDNPRFEFSPAHAHYHLAGFAEYRLLDGAGVVTTGRKQAFCLEDTTQRVDGVEGKYYCGNQGITAGWADTYSRILDCQWIDVTDVPAGAYTLQIEVNPDELLPESNLDNNLFELSVSL